jgi:hypothetical protein
VRARGLYLRSHSCHSQTAMARREPAGYAARVNHQLDMRTCGTKAQCWPRFDYSQLTYLPLRLHQASLSSPVVEHRGNRPQAWRAPAVAIRVAVTFCCALLRLATPSPLNAASGAPTSCQWPSK